MLSNRNVILAGITVFLASWLVIPVIADRQQPVNEITFTPLKHSEWLDKLSTYQPNIVVVDMWATWCSTCLEEFPKIVDLHNQYKDQGVQFVSMNLDDHDDQPALENAEKFLRNMNATFDNFWMDENLMTAFEDLNLIGIPAVIIYDRKGHEQYRLTGDNPNNQYSENDIDAAIQQLLAH